MMQGTASPTLYMYALLSGAFGIAQVTVPGLPAASGRVGRSFFVTDIYRAMASV